MHEIRVEESDISTSTKKGAEPSSYTVKYQNEFPIYFWSAQLGRSKSDLLFTQKAHFCTFYLLFDCQQVGDLRFGLLFNFFYVWASVY